MSHLAVAPSQHRDKWLGVLPTGWKAKRLKYISDITSSGVWGDDVVVDSKGHPVITTANIDAQGNIHLEGMNVRLLSDSELAQGVCSPGDIIVVKSSGSATNVISGKAGLIKAEHGQVYFNNFTLRVRPKKEVLEPRFAWFFLNSELVRAQIKLMVATTTYPNLPVEEYVSFLVPLPSRADQRIIADYLDGETLRLDALVAQKKRLLELLDEKRQSLITRAVTRGLDQHVPMRGTGIEWIPQVPRHWTPTNISRLFRQSKRLGFADLTVLSVYRDYGVIERATRDDNANRVPDDLEKYQLVEPGDLVINKMKAWQGSLGIAELNGITSPDYVVFSPLHRAVPRFLHYLLRNQILTTIYMSMSNGIRTNQWRLEPDRFGTLQLFLPPIDEQRAIVAHITAEIAKLDALSRATESTIVLLKERRAALIAAAVTGQLQIT